DGAGERARVSRAAHHHPGGERSLAGRRDLPVAVGSDRPGGLEAGRGAVEEELLRDVADLAEVEARHDDLRLSLDRPGQARRSVHLRHFTGATGSARSLDMSLPLDADQRRRAMIARLLSRAGT